MSYPLEDFTFLQVLTLCDFALAREVGFLGIVHDRANRCMWQGLMRRWGTPARRKIRQLHSAETFCGVEN